MWRRTSAISLDPIPVIDCSWANWRNTFLHQILVKFYTNCHSFPLNSAYRPAWSRQRLDCRLLSHSIVSRSIRQRDCTHSVVRHCSNAGLQTLNQIRFSGCMVSLAAARPLWWEILHDTVNASQTSYLPLLFHTSLITRKLVRKVRTVFSKRWSNNCSSNQYTLKGT